MHRYRALRIASSAVLLGVALVVGVSSASAQSRPLTRPQARAALRIAAATANHALIGGLLPHVAPNPFQTLELMGDPQPVTVNGTTYEMTVDATSEPGQTSEPPWVQVSLDRLQTANGRPVAEQVHLYTYVASGISLTAAADHSTGALDTGSAVTPTRIDTTLQRTGLKSQPCRVVTGRKSHAFETTGSLTTSAFNVVTDTSPFFGTLTDPPTTGELIDDPGCENMSFGNPTVTISVNQAGQLQPCSGRETIQSGSFFGSALWDMEVGVDGGKADIVGIVGKEISSVSGVTHLGGTLGPATQLPAPSRGPHGATAHVNATGSLFTGKALFFSHHPPRISPIQRCTYERHVRRYRAYRYAGGLKPVAGSPLTALFDTGNVEFHGHAAALIVRKYIG